MNNVLAHSSTPVPYIATTPPSPTAVAINLLNVLKIANTMSHPLYNPYVPGKQSSSQGQYGHSSGPAERDPRKTSPHLAPGSGFSSSGASSVTLGNTGEKIPSLLALPTSYRPERSRATVDADIERSVDLHISRAREEVRHQPVGQGTRFTGSQREEFPSSSTGMTSYLTSSASQGHRHSDVESGSTSLDWLPIYKKSSEDHSSKMYPSASSGYVSSGDGRFKASAEGQRDMLSIPGLGDFDDPMQDKSAPPKESGRPKYTSESASNILLHFGLEKEDLEHLISYPEDQITPDNLPFILRQIRIQKAKRVATAGHSVPYSKPQPTKSVSEMDRLSTTIGAGMHPDEMSSAILKPSQVIDYGHTGKYTAGVGNEIGRTIGSTANSGGSSGILLMNTFSNSSHSREPLQRSTKEMKSSTSIPSHDQMSSVTSFGSMRSPVVPPSSDPAKRLQTQMNQTSQSSIFTNFSIPKTDTDARRLISESLPLKPPEPDRQLTSKTQPPCTLFRGVHPGRPGLVLIGSNDGSCSNTKAKTQGQAPKVAEQMKKQQTQQQMKKQPPTQQSQQQQVQHHLKQPLQSGQPLQPRVLPPAKLVPLPSVIPGIAGVPPTPPQPISSQKEYSPRTPLTSSNVEIPTNVNISERMPTPAMLQDYAAASPRVFPHACLLCNWECTNMKDWITHQNSSLHLENCRLLRTRYPEWDGEIRPLQSAPGKDVKPSPSASAQTSQNRHQTTRHKSASLLQSPHCQRGSEDRREKRSSRSRSRSPRYHCGSEGRRERRSIRSRSRSPRHCYGSEGRRERRSSRSWSPHTSRHTRRSRSKSHERRPSPRRRDEKRSSPTRSRERRSPPRRGEDRRPTPPRSHERRPSAERSLPQRRRSNSAERLAKRLLETSAAQSLSKQSNLEAMVKTLAPALLAELAKMKSASSSSAPSAASSSSSNVAKKAGTAKTAKAKPSLQRPMTSSTAKPPKLVKSSPPTMVRLKGIYGSLSHNDVGAAVGNFGKTKSVVLFRSKLEAVVCFEKVEDAEKLRNKKSFNVKGLLITVIREKDAVSKRPHLTSTKEQKKPPQQKSTNPGVTAAQTSKATSTGKVKAPSSLTSVGKKNATGKIVTKAKVLVSKAKHASTKPTVKTVKADSVAGRGGGKSGEVTKEASALSGAKELKIPQKKLKTGDSKPTTALESPKGSAKKTDVAPKEKADRPSNVSVSEPLKGKETKAETRQEHKTEAKNSTAAKAVKEEVAEETEAKVKQEPLGSTVSENQPDAAEKFLSKILEIKTEGSAPVPGDTGEVVELKDEKLFDVKKQAEHATADVETEEIKDNKRLELGETGTAEPMEVESSAESKEQKLTDAEALPDKPSDSLPSTSTPPADSPGIQQASAPESKGEKMIGTNILPTKVCDSHTPTSAVQTATSEPFADPPQSLQATFRTQETSIKASAQVQQSQMPHPESTSQEPETKTKHQNQQQAAGSLAEAALKAKQTVGGQETKTKQKDNQTEDPVTAAKTQQDPLKAVGGVSAASPEATSAKSKPTLSPAAAVIPPTVREKTEKHQQHDKTSCVQMETSKLLKPSLSEPSGNGQQPTPQSTASATPATSAGSIFPGPVATEATGKVAKRVEKPGTEMTARPAKATEGGQKVKEEGSVAASVTPAHERTLPAANSALSPGIPDESEEKEIPHIDEDIFRAITTALREHRLTQRSATTSQDKEDTSKSPVSAKDEGTPQEKALDIQAGVVTSEPFNEENFNFDDFVTVDEISEDMEEAAVDDGSSSRKQASSDKKREQGLDASSNAKKTSKRSSKDSKSSSASKSASKSSSSSSVSPKKQKDSSESTKSQTKPSSSASVSKTSSSSSQSAEASVSSGLKAQPSKAKSHAPSGGRSTRSSAAAVKMSTSHKVEVKPTVTAVTKSDHQRSEESSAAKNVESEIKIKTSSEMDPPAQRREFESTNQTQSLKTDFKDETPKEVKMSKDEGRKDDDDGKQTEEEGDDGDNYRILDSLDDAADEQMAEEEKQDRSTEIQTSGPEPGQRSHEKDHQVSVEDQGKSCLEQCIKMETDASNQVQNSIMKDPEAAVQEDSDLIKDGSSTVNQVSEGVMTSAVNSSDKSSLTSSTNQVMDKDTNQIPQTRGEGGRLKHKEEEVLSQEFCKTTTDDEQISQDKNHPLEDRDNKDTLKDFTEQEAFETVDSVDDQTVTEGDSQKPETPGEQISEGNIEPTEEDAYQVIDSVEDQPTTTEVDSRGDRTKKDNVTAERDDRPNRRSGLRTGTCKSEEKEKSPKKPDRTAEKNKSPTKDSTTGKDKHVVENTEEMVYEVVDSVEDESVQETSTTERSGRRRTTRGNKDHKTTTTIHKEVPERPAGEEETEFKILDSVEDEVASDEPTVTRRSTRARREKAKKDAENEKPNKDKTPTGRRTKSARDSGDRNKEKATETEATTPPEENTQTKKSECVVGNAAEEEATYEILDAVEEEAAGEDRPATPEKPRRGRPKKDVKTTRKQPAAVKKEDSSSRRADEEEAIYQILDSVEDEPVRAPIDQSKNVSQLAISKDDDKTKGASSLINEEEEEPVYHIVDSLEDDQVQEELMTTQVSSTKRGERSEAVLEITTKDEAAAKEDSITSDSTAVEVSKEEVEEEKSLLQLADDVEKVGDDPSAAEGSGTGEEDRTPKTDVKKEDRPATVSRCDAATSEKKQKMAKRNETVAAESALVNLDEVSEEEDDYPDDTAEEEELKKKQAAAKERKKEQEERRSRARGDTKREQRIQSSSSGVRARRAKERDLEKVEVDNQELVTLDEVGEDEASEEGAIEGGGWDRELLEGELQELVTLDEIVEEGEEGKEEQRTLERLPVRQEGQSADLLKPENQATLAEAGGDEDKKADEDQAEKTTMSAKRKHGDDDTGESVNFVTVDEVGKSEEEQEAATTRTKGRPKKKRSRQTPVRKYARGNTLSKEDEEKEPVPAASLDSSSTPDKDASALSNDVQLEAQKKEVGAANQSDVVAASAGQQPQSERPDNKTLEGGVEGQRGKEGPNRADFKVTDKRRRELVGPEAKRSRSLSPCVAADFKLPPFNPRSPLGQEFVVPKSGFFCNLCSVFYLNESAAKETHCSSQTHYNNLLKHYQKLQQKTAALTHASQSSVSD